MNDFDYEKKLESAVDGALKGLGEISAPPSLRRRILGAVERQAARPWYLQGWAAWPAAARTGSLVILVGILAAAWWAAGEARAWPAQIPANSWAHPWLAAGGAIRSVGHAVIGVVSVIGQRLGPGALVAGFLLLALAHGICLGLGTLCIRLSFAPTPQPQTSSL